jgi:2,3-bisphosphoglycerate-dependent phosphoglycerate mutase
MHLYLIRHGQSHVNLAEWDSGNTDEGLTELGQKQAAALGGWLPRFVPDVEAIYASTMRRALETAEYLAEA